MDIDEILEAFGRDTGKYPREAVKAAIEKQEEITPELLRIVEDTVSLAQELIDGSPDGLYSAHLYAIYLLAQFREVRAYPLIIRYARLKMDVLDELAGDFITEDLGRVLASVCGGDTGLIQELAEDSSVDEYVRSAALRSLVVLVAMGDKDRDEVMAYFKSLFEGKLERTQSHAWDTLVHCALSIHPAEVSEHIDKAMSEGLVDPMFISKHEIEEAFRQDRESVLAKLPSMEGRYIEDTIKAMEWWDCFSKNDHSEFERALPPPFSNQSRPRNHYQPRDYVKILPNEPCSCGSGKKFKKCCGRLD